MNVTADRLSRRYQRPGGGDVVAVDDVTAIFPEGEVSAVVGRSGSGKSTLIRMLGGLEASDSGRVQIGSHDISRLGKHGGTWVRRTLVSMVFQDHGLVAEMSVRENLILALRISGLPTQPQRISESLDQVGMDGFQTRRVSTLSGGEQQRVAIARALALQHPVLLADEPTGSLDEDNAVAVAETLVKAAQAGCAVVVATHDPIVTEHATAVWRMSSGRLVAT